MSRRALPVAVAAAALVFVPSTASATPDQVPVTMVGESLYAHTTVSMPDGRRVHASLSELQNGPGSNRRAAVSVSVSPGRYCWPTSLCGAGTGHAFVELSPDALDFDRNLAEASIIDLPVTLERWTVTPAGTFAQVQDDVRISVRFTGIGDVVHDTYHGDACGDGSSECRSTRVDASRDATATVTLDEDSAVAAGYLSRGRYVDAAIRYSDEFPG